MKNINIFIIGSLAIIVSVIAGLYVSRLFPSENNVDKRIEKFLLSEESIKKSSYNSPSLNYKNPYKECSYSRAYYENPPFYRYCVHENKIIRVNKYEKIEFLGVVGTVEKKKFLYRYDLFEWKIEGNEIILYRCEELNGSCNGTTRREVIGWKRNVWE